MIVYLHGFISSPFSHKATLLRDSLNRQGRGAEWLAPAIPPYPAEADHCCCCHVSPQTRCNSDSARNSQNTHKMA
ncbi:MAG: YqiA/YcfP family alpha/beta fold hydrolase [Burkholderiales bacterium]